MTGMNCDRIQDDNVPIIYQSQMRITDTPIAYSFINYTIFLLVFLGFLYIAPFVHFGFISFVFENITKNLFNKTDTVPPQFVNFDSDTAQTRKDTNYYLLSPIIKNVAGKITYYHSINLVQQNDVKGTYFSYLFPYLFKPIGLNTIVDAFMIFVYLLTMFIILGMGFSSESSDDQLSETTAALYKAVSLFMLILFFFMVPRIKVFYKNLADGKPMV